MDDVDDGVGRWNDDDRMCRCGGGAGALVKGAAVRQVLRAMSSMLLRERWGKKWEAGDGEYDRAVESVIAWR